MRTTSLVALLTIACSSAAERSTSDHATATPPAPAPEPVPSTPETPAEPAPEPPAAEPPAITMELQILGPRYRPGDNDCFRWIGDLRDRTYENQPRAISVELANGHRMSIPYVAEEADAYVSPCVPIARLGEAENVTARFRAELGETSIDETLLFVRETPADDSFVSVRGTTVPPSPAL
jgi:hypothetical protein